MEYSPSSDGVCCIADVGNLGVVDDVRAVSKNLHIQN